MANIMNPVFPVGGVERTAPPVKPDQKSGDKFSDHLDRKMQDRTSREDKVGLKRRQEGRQSSKRAAVEKERDVAAPKKKPGSDAEAAGALALFMQDLQQIAQSPELGVGEWIVPVEDGDFMQEFAAHSGMSELDLLALAEKFQAEDGSLDLPSFFNALGEHFADFETNPGVLIPETEFPLLASLLEKMGLSNEQLQLLSDKAVVGDGQLDLAIFTESLAELQGGGASGPEDLLQPVTLSKAEVQQLQDLLGKVGLQLGEQLELLPEQLFGKDVILSMERLQSMLEQGVNEAESAFPKVDLAAFLQDLEKVMEGAKFVDQSAGISPLVQNSLVDAYKNLLDMFEAVQERFKEGLADEEMVFSGDIEKWRAGVVERLAALTGVDPKHISVESLGVSSLEVTGETPVPVTEMLTPVAGGGGQAVTVDPASVHVASPADQPPPVRHFIPGQQQQIFDQLGLAIGRGLKSGEHHLVLRLHPVELGEVKVDLVMRGEEISAHFKIENSKVKETLESSMEEFRQSMEQKGFTLGSLNVSVGGQDDAGEAWQRFEMGWSGERLQADTLEDLPDDILYHRSNREQYANPEQGVNLFV